jgi:hypothetical protein
VGFFFGLATTRAASSLRHEFEAIEVVQPLGASSASAGLRILWSQYRIFEDGDSAKTEQTALADCPIARPNDGEECTLRVTLGSSGLPQIAWNGRALPLSLWTLSFDARQRSNVSADRLRLMYLGRLGLIVSDEASHFRRMRLRYEREPTR